MYINGKKGSHYKDGMITLNINDIIISAIENKDDESRVKIVSEDINTLYIYPIYDFPDNAIKDNTPILQILNSGNTFTEIDKFKYANTLCKIRENNKDSETTTSQENNSPFICGLGSLFTSINDESEKRIIRIIKNTYNSNKNFNIFKSVYIKTYNSVLRISLCREDTTIKNPIFVVIEIENGTDKYLHEILCKSMMNINIRFYCKYYKEFRFSEYHRNINPHLTIDEYLKEQAMLVLSYNANLEYDVNIIEDEVWAKPVISLIDTVCITCY